MTVPKTDGNGRVGLVAALQLACFDLADIAKTEEQEMPHKTIGDKIRSMSKNRNCTEIGECGLM
jgi:hypothetical protein